MKNIRKPKHKIIKELARYFDQELKATLPISILPDGSLSYKSYIVKQLKSGSWGLYTLRNKELVHHFFLKSCALMAAKAYNSLNMHEFDKIKELDSRYWANHTDSLIYKHNMKTAKDIDRYIILLNKLDNSESREIFCKKEILKMFKWSFA